MKLIKLKFYLMAIISTFGLMQYTHAASITETYEDPLLGKVERTITYERKPHFTNYSIHEKTSSLKDLTPAQQEQLSDAMAKWSSAMLQNGLQSNYLFNDLAKISGMPFDEQAFQKQTNDAATFIGSKEGQTVMKKNLGLMLKILPQMEASSTQIMKQMEQHNRLLQEQLETIFR